jgi:hypothetical protein
MLRTAAKKVAWVGRTASMVFGLALVMALLLGLASMAWGAAPTKGNFVLGTSNVASAVTQLTANVSGPALNLINNSTAATATALNLDVAQGHAPLTVNSSQKVANLNVDQVDGKSDTDFYAAGSTVADSEKLDNKDSTDFYAAGSKVADSEKLDGQDSTAFLGKFQTAFDSERLDGQDSTAFARADQFGSAVTGRTGDGGGLGCYLGEVRLFAGAETPRDWEMAHGQLLSISQNLALFSLLGTNYGGDGRTTFALPDLRGAEPKGAGPAAPYYAICVEGVFP